MSIHQQALINAGPAQVCAVLADPNALSTLSGRRGVMARSEAEEFSAFDGHVVGRRGRNWLVPELARVAADP